MEEHVANCRKDWIEKETKRLTDTYQLIGIENLSIQGMMKGSTIYSGFLDELNDIMSEYSDVVILSFIGFPKNWLSVLSA